MTQEPNGTEFWIEISKSGTNYAVNQWQTDSGSSESQLRKAQAERATWLTLAASTPQELKFKYQCENSDHSGNSTLEGFATLTRVSEEEIKYALVTPPSVGSAWDCNGDFDVEFNSYKKMGEALGEAKPLAAAPSSSDASFIAGRPYETLFVKGATWTIKSRVQLTRGDEIQKGPSFKKEANALSNTCIVEAVAQRPGKIGATISCSPHTWQPKATNGAMLGAWPLPGGFWIASEKGLQLVSGAETLETAIAMDLKPDGDAVSQVLVKPAASDAKACFPVKLFTEESAYEFSLCLERAIGFSKVDAAINWNAGVEPEGLTGKTTAITYAAPTPAK